MNEDTINDLKQFISATVSQQTSDLRQDIQYLDKKIDSSIKQLDVKLSTKIDDLSDSVAEALTASNDAIDRTIKDHEHRISRLETAAQA